MYFLFQMPSAALLLIYFVLNHFLLTNLKMNRQDEKLCLKWNDFQENAISAFGTLRNDREFADVTLACEDGQQVEAHKVILSLIHI